MTTAGDIVTSAFRKSGLVGIGQTIDGSDFVDALSDLGDMLAQWNEKRWLIWHLVDCSFVSTGATSYTVGPGGNFDVSPRPSRIEAAYCRMLNQGTLPVDMPLKVIDSAEDFSRIALKSLVSFPAMVYLDASTPMGVLHVYPNPNAGIYEIHILLKDVWPTSLAANTSFANYPPFTIPAMKFNLARRLRQSYGKGRTPDLELNALAKDALETIRSAQVQSPSLKMPASLIQTGVYNIYSDQIS